MTNNPENRLCLHHISLKYVRLSVWVIILFALSSCTTGVQVNVGILWDDDSYYSRNDTWYVGIANGNHLDVWSDVMTPIVTRQVLSGQDCEESFMLPDDDYSELTAFVFCDTNNNQVYDDGIDDLTGFKPGSRDEYDNYYLAVGAYH